MGAKSLICKWGCSLAVRIPEPIAEQWGVREGSTVEWRWTVFVDSRRNGWFIVEDEGRLQPMTSRGFVVSRARCLACLAPSRSPSEGSIYELWGPASYVPELHGTVLAAERLGKGFEKC